MLSFTPSQLPRLAFIAGLILTAIGFLYDVKLPDRVDIDPSLMIAPSQTQTSRENFSQSYDGKNYDISPQYDYTLYGLVVSQRDLEDSWFNIYYDRDPLNIKDICVIWGGNLLSDDFKKVSYSSGMWTCNFSYKSDVIFDHHALSNNHILPANAAVADILDTIREGDQIMLQGHLVNYSVNNAGERKSSTTRLDDGNGACEVVYANELRLLKKGDRRGEWIKNMGLFLLAAVFCYIVYDWFLKPYFSDEV